MSTTITTVYHILVEETPTEVIHPNASDLAVLLLLVVLAVHSVHVHLWLDGVLGLAMVSV